MSVEEQLSALMAKFTELRTENEKLREALGEAWGVVEELVTQCAPDVRTSAWPIGFGFSPKDVKRINKLCEQVLNETQEKKT